MEPNAIPFDGCGDSIPGIVVLDSKPLTVSLWVERSDADCEESFWIEIGK